MLNKKQLNTTKNKFIHVSIILFVAIIGCLIQTSWQYTFLLLIPLTMLILNTNINKITVVFGIVFFGVLFMEISLLKNWSFFNWISTLINSCYNFKKHLVGFVESHYQKETSSFIKLIVLNQKDQLSYDIYKNILDLNIVYLLVVSGLHLSIMQAFFRKMIKVNLIFNIVCFITILFYCYLLGFSSSTMRVFICLILGWKIKNKYMRLSLSAMIILLLSPLSSRNYGFMLSYLCCFIVYWINEFDIENKFIKQIIINLLCILISLPFIILMSGKFSIFIVFFSLIFSYVFIFMYIYFVLFFWFVWIEFVHLEIIHCLITTIKSLSKINVVCYIHIQKIYFCLYTYVFFLIYTYFSKKNNIGVLLKKPW